MPFGLITANEKMFDTINSGTFDLPENSSIVETRIVSYSGSKWTNEVTVNDNSIFNLTFIPPCQHILACPLKILSLKDSKDS